LFRILKPGTRIVSHQFGMGEWEPDKALTVRTVTLGMWGEMANPFENNPRVPDYTANEMHFGTSDKVLMWVVPAPVAGIWRGKIDTAEGPRDCRLVLHQHLSQVAGTFQLSGGQPNLAGYVKADLWGDHLRFECIPEHMRYGYFELRFDGHIRQNTIRGTLAISQAGQQHELQWQAERDKADFRGVWQWPSSTGDRSVELKIERGDNGLVATYRDREKVVPVTDFYDCGGGFYFTLLIGREANGSLRITNDTGWLIGEAILDGGSLQGKIEFYPYEHASVVATNRNSPHEMIRNWKPLLIRP
jgi:hypothetical protein